MEEAVEEAEAEVEEAIEVIAVATMLSEEEAEAIEAEAHIEAVVVMEITTVKKMENKKNGGTIQIEAAEVVTEETVVEEIIIKVMEPLMEMVDLIPQMEIERNCIQIL